MKNLLFIILGFLFFSGTTPEEDPPTGYEIAMAVFASTKKINSLAYVMEKKERIDAQFIHQSAFVKLNRSPYKVYTRQEHPDKGLEVLYVHGENGNKALISPTGFPWVNLKLDPLGSVMRKEQHHTILDAGYDYVISILEHLFEKYGKEKVTAMIQNKGTTSWGGHSCWTIEFNNPHFKYEDYTVREGENIHVIAKKRKVSGHMVLEINEDIEDYDDISPGQVIRIPNDYSPKLVLIVDQQRMIPLLMEIYDDKGLYEQYAYKDIKINPSFSSVEFTAAYEAYDF